MNTVSKLFTEPNAIRLESILNELVLAFNYRRLSILNRYNINEMDVEIIRYLMAEDQKKMKEVGEYFNIKLSTLTSTIDKLEKSKLVKRKNSREDRRVIFIKPTARGANLLNELDDTMRNLSESMIRDTSAPEFESMINGLDRILAYVKGE